MKRLWILVDLVIVAELIDDASGYGGAYGMMMGGGYGGYGDGGYGVASEDIGKAIASLLKGLIAGYPAGGGYGVGGSGGVGYSGGGSTIIITTDGRNGGGDEYGGGSYNNDERYGAKITTVDSINTFDLTSQASSPQVKQTNVNPTPVQVSQLTLPLNTLGAGPVQSYAAPRAVRTTSTFQNAPPALLQPGNPIFLVTGDPLGSAPRATDRRDRRYRRPCPGVTFSPQLTQISSNPIPAQVSTLNNPGVVISPQLTQVNPNLIPVQVPQITLPLNNPGVAFPQGFPFQAPSLTNFNNLPATGGIMLIPLTQAPFSNPIGNPFTVI